MKDLDSAISSFKCYLDNDIENFLHTKAIDFLKRGIASTYLILNDELLNQNIIKIEAFFTLSHKAIDTPKDISKSQIKKITHNKNSTILNFILIGQIGKHLECDKNGICCEKSSIDCNTILKQANSIIKYTCKLIPSRFILIECNDCVRDLKIYDNENFEYFQYDGDSHQYIKKI